jgi:hypothetical protein
MGMDPGEKQVIFGTFCLSAQPSGSDESQNYVWKKLWRLPVPPKVRCFWWRVMKKFVPTR